MYGIHYQNTSSLPGQLDLTSLIQFFYSSKNSSIFFTKLIRKENSLTGVCEKKNVFIYFTFKMR